MRLFQRSPHHWWQKPLVRVGTDDLPAELVILRDQLQPGESGAWLNSRGIATGAVDLVAKGNGRFRTVRVPLPDFVRDQLKALYTATGLKKGVPDLVIWRDTTRQVRFVEVKCPDWDRPSAEQLRFHDAARLAGCDVEIAEWRFS